MATYNGDECYCAFITASGTAVLTGNQRTVDLEETMETADHTGGTANYRRRKKTVGDISVSVEVLWPGEGGTAANAIVAMGAEGTIWIAPLGTASGKPKGAYPVIPTGRSLPIPFDGELLQTYTFEGNGDPVHDVFTAVY